MGLYPYRIQNYEIFWRDAKGAEHVRRTRFDKKTNKIETIEELLEAFGAQPAEATAEETAEETADVTTIDKEQGTKDKNVGGEDMRGLAQIVAGTRGVWLGWSQNLPQPRKRPSRPKPLWAAPLLSASPALILEGRLHRGNQVHWGMDSTQRPAPFICRCVLRSGRSPHRNSRLSYSSGHRC
jgi:hypothetical protein